VSPDNVSTAAPVKIRSGESRCPVASCDLAPSDSSSEPAEARVMYARTAAEISDHSAHTVSMNIKNPTPPGSKEAARPAITRIITVMARIASIAVPKRECPATIHPTPLAGSARSSTPDAAIMIPSVCTEMWLALSSQRTGIQMLSPTKTAAAGNASTSTAQRARRRDIGSCLKAVQSGAGGPILVVPDSGNVHSQRPQTDASKAFVAPHSPQRTFGCAGETGQA
jgi:hypothetical protein